MKFTKSERVKVIQDVAEHLKDDEWSYIDLVLKQFGFPISDHWSGGKDDYVVQMIGDSKDGELAELGMHFGMQFPQNGAEKDPIADTPYWEDGKLRVFISHLTEHKKLAAQIKTSLSRRGLCAFVAHNDIHPTTEWQIEIETALSTCDLLVALIHPNFVESKWCDQEIGFALGRGVAIFAVSCGADPHGFVGRFQAFNGNGKNASEISKEIFEAALDHKKLQSKMADIVIDLFTRSGSFAAAKERIEFVEKLKVWDDSYSPRLKKALKDNDQISGSWGVADRMGAVIKKWSK